MLSQISNGDLRQLNEALTALDAVDIQPSIENFIAIATAPAPPGDVERLHLKEQACLYLGIALLQGLGRIDEAMFWWRQRKAVAAEIFRIQFGDHAYDSVLSEGLIYDQFWSAHIGHTALFGLHVKRNLLEGEPFRRLALIRISQANRGNSWLVNRWREYATVADEPSALPFPFFYSPYTCKNIYLEESLAGPDCFYWDAYAQIARSWEEAGGGALLKLSPREMRRGSEYLATLGIPPGAWYVCLHVRSRGFARVHEGLQDTLNADIATYELVIESILERGGWVVRMGDASMPKLPARHGVIDYAHSPRKADWMDVFLCATCRFYVGTSSGLAYVPNLFGAPGVFTNWFPTGTRPLNGKDIFIPKLHWYDSDHDFAPFAESLAPPLGHLHAKPTLRSLGVSVRDNTGEELRDVVVEMLDRLDGKTTYTDEDESLNRRFDSVARKSRSHGNARIGRSFIRKYRHLLPVEQEKRFRVAKA